MATEQRNRTLAALTETCQQLEKAESYMAKFQDTTYIAFLKSHIEKLETMLAN